jgi:LemA protein
MNKVLLGILAVIVAIALSAIGFYNSMVGMDEWLKSLQAQVDNMYERRVDLIPQLTAVVKKYTEYESGTLKDVVALREWTANLEALQWMADAGQTKSPEFNNLLASTLSSIKLTIEAYPELKADTQFTALFTELEGSENRIRTAIKDFNDTVSGYNLKVRSFPRGKLFSWMFGFTAKERITPPAEKAIKEVPNVEELLN